MTRQDKEFIVYTIAIVGMIVLLWKNTNGKHRFTKYIESKSNRIGKENEYNN